MAKYLTASLKKSSFVFFDFFQ